MRVYNLNDKESKTLLNMADDCIDRGMIGEEYEAEKISRILDYGYELYHKTGGDFEVEIEVKIKNKSKTMSSDSCDSRDRFVQVHDCYFDVFNEIPRMETIHYVIEQLPREIKLLAQQWGWSDTEVRDNVYNWIKENKEKLK